MTLILAEAAHCRIVHTNWVETFSKVALSNTEIYIYSVLQTIQMKLILLCVWEEQVVLGSAKTALKFKYEI